MMFEFLNYSFMERAIVAGTLVAIITGIVGPFLVFRKMSFMGAGLSHGALAGIALGIILGLSPTLMSVLIVMGLGFLIGLVSRTGKISEDSAIGTVYTFFMALGIFLINLSKGYHINIMGYLFGDILAISKYDILFALIVLIVVLVWLILRGRAMLYLTFDEDFAKITGVPIGWDYYIFMVITSLSIITVVKLVGVVLAGSILIVPSASAKMLSKSFMKIIAISVISGIISIFSGIAFSYYLNTSSGPSIVFFVTAFFLCVLLWQFGSNTTSRKVKIKSPSSRP